jgi:hypothetical protein
MRRHDKGEVRILGTNQHWSWLCYLQAEEVTLCFLSLSFSILIMEGNAL